MNKKNFGILLSAVMLILGLNGVYISAFAEEIIAEDYDFDSVNSVVEAIDGIGDVTIHSVDKIKEARSAYDGLPDSEKDFVENFSILIEAEAEINALYAEVSDTDHGTIYEATREYIFGLGTPGVGSVGGEWMVIGLTRSGYDCPEGYYENALDYVQENINDNEQLHRAKSTENSRLILALTSAGYDVTNVGGHNLLKGLSDMSYLKRQGINGPIWALIAFDSYDYEIPQNENEETQATREGIIAYILEKQFDDGGWAMMGDTADPDMTGMAVQALAPYYNSNSDVRSAVDRALDCLSDIQRDNGTYGSVDGSCIESCAQVIVALTALGIDPEADDRFVKNGISVVDAICIFAVEGGGFEHVPYGGLNGMATEQGQYGLAAYFRFLEGMTSLYDMTDVEVLSVDIGDDADVTDDYIEDSDDGYADEFYFDDIEDSEPEENDIEEPVVQHRDRRKNFMKSAFVDIRADDWYLMKVLSESKMSLFSAIVQRGSILLFPVY